MNEIQEQTTVDVLVVGSGAGGFTTALTARARGLDVLMIEKDEHFGGSSALSGGGLWVPGAPVQRRAGYRPDPADTLKYLEGITAGLVDQARLRAYVDAAPEMLEFLEELDPNLEFIWKPGYPDYFPELPGGSGQGSVINIPPIDLRRLGDDEHRLLVQDGITPNGLWIAPNELVDFYRLRQTWKGKRLFVKLVWRMLRARLTGERIVTIGQALMARLMLALRAQGVPLWLNSPMQRLLSDDEGRVVGAVVRRQGTDVEVRARGGVVLATGGFDHDPAMRHRHQPFAEPDLSLGADSNRGDGIRAAEAVGAATDLMDSAWWYPCISWGPGKTQFSLNERMMPSQLIVDSGGNRYINEATPYSEFGLAMIQGSPDGSKRIPSWLIIDDWSWRRYVVFGHLPLPKIPFSPAPTGHALPDAWRKSGSVHRAQTIAGLAERIGVPVEALEATVQRYNEVAATGTDTDFGRGESVYDRYYADVTLDTPNLLPLHGGPYYAFKLILADLGTNGGVRTDEYARALQEDGEPVTGLYVTGNSAAAVMGRSYAGAGATIAPSMTFGYVAAGDIADRLSVASLGRCDDTTEEVRP